MNPLGLHIVGFGPPTAEERRHDFLWRITPRAAAAGYVGVFNRSHYEDVLVVRVRGLVAGVRVAARGTTKINDFERKLRRGRHRPLVKVMLHISYDEQRERLLERLTDPTKHWKYNPATSRPGAVGRLPGGVRRGARAVQHGRRRPGTSCPPIASGIATGPSPVCCRRRSRTCDLHYPKPTFDVERRARTAAVPG